MFGPISKVLLHMYSWRDITQVGKDVVAEIGIPFV